MNRWSGFPTVLLLLFASGSVLALDLLESLNTEGNSIVLDKSGMAKNQPGAIVDHSLLIPKGSGCGELSHIGQTLIRGLSQADFERVLKRDHCGTSLFYKNISQPARQQVYDAYLLNPDLKALQQMILSKMPSKMK